MYNLDYFKNNKTTPGNYFMNYTYNDEQNKQQQPQGQGGYVIQLGTPPQQQQPPLPENMYQPTPKEQQAFMMARLSRQLAEVRLTESRLLLHGMEEIRAALDIRAITVAEKDSGSGERPPLEPAFNETNRERLQNAYLRITERLVNYYDHFIQHDMGIKVTNEIKKDDGISK